MLIKYIFDIEQLNILAYHLVLLREMRLSESSILLMNETYHRHIQNWDCMPLPGDWKYTALPDQASNTFKLPLFCS